MRRGRLIQLCVVLFIGINFLLVYFDDEGKVERKSYIKNWSEAFQADMKEQLFTPGVMASVGEEYVYFDKGLGQFQEFLTEEGAYVNPGDPLYSYKVNSFYESEIRLSNEVQKLEGEVTAIESAIKKMEQHQLPTAATQESKSVKITKEEIKVELPEDTTEAAVIKEQYIVEKEKELGQKQSELESAKSQLTELQTSGDTIIVDSPFEGRIKSLTATLEDPIITIENAALQAKGEFIEKERTKIEPGLPVEVMVKEKKVSLDGVLSDVGESPETVDVEGESVYPFGVTFDKEAETDELLPGYHADLAITLQESPNATVLFEDVVFNGSVWKMTSEGRVQKQAIETGIHMDKMQEITKGLKQGEWVAREWESQFRPGAPFITPLKVSKIQWKQLNKQGSKGENIVTGILSR